MASLAFRLMQVLVGVFRRKPLWAGAQLMFFVLVAVYAFSMDIRASRGSKITGNVVGN